MATIPHTPDRSRLPGIPDVRVGVPRVTAEDFGAAKLRDVIDLSRAGQESGLEQMRYAHGYAKAEADQVYAVAYGEASKEQVQLAQTKGNEATDVPERMQKAVQRIAEKHRGSIKTANGRAMFDRMMMDVGREKDVWAYQHKLKEEGDAVATGVMAKNESESDGVIAMAGQGAGVEHVIGGIQRIKANNAELYRGMPKEKIDLENRKSTMDVIEKSAARIAANPTLGPQAAMDFLDSGIEQEVAGGEVEKAMFNEIRQAYQVKAVEAEQKAIVDAGTSRMIKAVRAGGDPSAIFEILVDEVGLETATKIIAGYEKYAGLADKYAKRHEEAAKAESEADKAARAEREKRGDEILTQSAREAGRAAGFLSLKEARDKAYAEFPDKYAEIMIKAAEAEQKAITAEQAAAAIDEEERLGAELKAAGYNALKMPSYPKFPPDKQKKWLDLGKSIREATAQKTKVDGKYYLETMFDRSADELAAIFADPKRREELAARLGGVTSQQYRDVAAKLKASGGGDGAKSGSKSDKIKSLDSILNNLKTEAEIVFADTGRFAGTDAQTKAGRDDAMNRILSYGRHEFESAMKRHNVDDIDALPLDERNRIFSEALVTYEIDEFGWNDPQYTRAEAWQQGLDTTANNVSLIRNTLPKQYRDNLVEGGTVREIPDGYIQVAIPLDSSPENVRAEAGRTGGRIMRDLASGWWLLVSPDGALEFPPDGENANPMDAKQAAVMAKVSLPGDEGVERTRGEWDAGMKMINDAAEIERRLYE